MTMEDLNGLIEELKQEGNSEEDIVAGFYKMFQDDKINFEQLEALVHQVGWEITDEFRNMSAEDQKTKGFEEVEDEVAEPAESTKETKEDEDKEESDAMSLFGLGNKK